MSSHQISAKSLVAVYCGSNAEWVHLFESKRIKKPKEPKNKNKNSGQLLFSLIHIQEPNNE